MNKPLTLSQSIKSRREDYPKPIYPHGRAVEYSGKVRGEFLVKELKNQTVGEFLAETRKEQNVLIERAALETKISKGHLLAIEACEYYKLPGGVYSEKILEAYANFLEVDFNCLRDVFRKELGVAGRKEERTFIPKVSSGSLLVAPRLIETLAVIGVVAAIFVYLGFEINNIFSPPSLIVTSPAENLVTDKPTIEISGKTESETTIKINEQEIQGDQNGFFKEIISLGPGLNVIKVSSAKKRGKESVVYRQIILRESE